MTYSQARVYYYADNNFDINNIPDSPQVLVNSSTYGPLDVINCLPLAGKQSTVITVKAFSKLNTTSYLAIQFDSDGFTWYGIVTGYEYVAMDRVAISLQIDGWLTCGGISAITSISGMTVRHHVLDDTFGKYTQPDPLTNPRGPLLITEGENLFSDDATTKQYKIVLATIDLKALGDTSYKDALTYVDPQDPESSQVSVPNVPYPETNATATMYTDPSTGFSTTEMPNVQIYDGDDEQVKRGMAKARSLGIESGIIGQYVVSSKFIVQPNFSGSTITSSLSGVKRTSTLSNKENNYEYATVMNKRLLYGENNHYVLVSYASGNKTEFSPEDIYDSTLNRPKVTMVADPRQSGKPYYRFDTFKGSNSNFFTNCVEGLQWQNAPLAYVATSGHGIALSIMANKHRSDAWNFMENYNIKTTSMLGSVMKNEVGDYSKIITNPDKVSSGSPYAPTGALAASYGIAIGETALEYASIEQQANALERSRQLEKMQYNVSNFVVAPEIQFPRSESLRDFLGNGVFVFRYRLSDQDLANADKLLNMYGYLDTAPLSIDDFKNMSYYNYVEASGVKITTSILNIPRHVKEIAQQQISAGVRVWHVNPDDTLYSQNNRPTKKKGA